MSGMVAVESLDSTLDDQIDDKDDLAGNLGIPTIMNVSVSIRGDYSIWTVKQEWTDWNLLLGEITLGDL